VNRALKVGALVLAAAVAGSVITIAVRGRARVALPPRPASGTARVVRADLVNTAEAEGTLTYGPSAPIVNGVAGVYTSVPPPGTTRGAGDVLYRVDDRPIVLMTGAVPAWRDFTLGMTDGPDVAELQANLVARGDGAGALTVATGHFDFATRTAIKRWQYSLGLAPTGVIARGDVVFLPTAVRVGPAGVAVGSPASPGDQPYAVTTTNRIVTVASNPSLPAVTPGEPVNITEADNRIVPGHVTGVQSVPPAATNSSNTSSSSSSSSTPETLIVVAPDAPTTVSDGAGTNVQVSLVTQSARGVLAVPISALLALASGGYGIEEVDSSGAHHLTAVSTGIFTGSQVAISGRGIAAGTTVVVAQ
jgi:peptidoglycan hydrolase-like protein with peptidoglycan-binding domain